MICENCIKIFHNKKKKLLKLKQSALIQLKLWNIFIFRQMKYKFSFKKYLKT